MRVAFAGTSEFAVPALAALLREHEVAGVLTQPDRPAGRGQQLRSSPVKQLAQQHKIEVAQPATLKTPEGREALQRWNPDVLVVVAYGLLLPGEALTIPRYGCLNIHASLLPRWRGAAPIHRALLAGDAETGVCIMQLDAGLDTGPVWATRKLTIKPQDTTGILHDALAQIGASELLAVLPKLAGGRALPQAANGASYAPRVAKSEALLDWSQSSDAIERRVRAFNPWPIAETRIAGQQLRIHEAALANMPLAPADAPLEPPGALPGQMFAAWDAQRASPQLLVLCGSGVLAPQMLQLPGRKPVSAAEFRNAWRGELPRLGI